MKDCFWLVWCHAHGLPNVKHTSEESAKREAARLADQNPGHVFSVMQSIGECEALRTKFTPHQNIPF